MQMASRGRVGTAGQLEVRSPRSKSRSSRRVWERLSRLGSVGSGDVGSEIGSDPNRSVRWVAGVLMRRQVLAMPTDGLA